MGKSTINKWAMFNSFLYVYQRVTGVKKRDVILSPEIWKASAQDRVIIHGSPLQAGNLLVVSS
jgi:hypothetical protein